MEKGIGPLPPWQSWLLQCHGSSTKKMFLFGPCTQNWGLCSQVISYPHFSRGLGQKKPPWNVDLSRSNSSPWISCLCYLVIRAPWNWTKQIQDHKPGKFGYYGKVIKRTHWKWWHRRGVSIAVCFYLLLWYFVRECLIASIQYKF